MESDIARNAAARTLAPEVRFLRCLVTVLAMVMGGGMLAIVIILWLRLAAAPGAGELWPLPRGVTLPEGEIPAAVTFSARGLIVVTASGLVLFYDPKGMLSGQLRQP